MQGELKPKKQLKPQKEFPTLFHDRQKFKFTAGFVLLENINHILLNIS
jgi:hypothetical protein